MEYIVTAVVSLELRSVVISSKRDIKAALLVRVLVVILCWDGSSVLLGRSDERRRGGVEGDARCCVERAGDSRAEAGGRGCAGGETERYGGSRGGEV